MKPVILIADDDPEVRNTLGRFLESQDMNVVFATNCIQTLFEFLIMPYDLALLDLRMPGPGGWEVYDALSKLHPRMPIIIMTGMPNQRAHAERIGVDALLEKPINPLLLLDTIRTALARREPVRVTRMTTPHRRIADPTPAVGAQPTINV